MRVSFVARSTFRVVCELECYRFVNREMKNKAILMGYCLKVFAGFQEQSDINNILEVWGLVDLGVEEEFEIMYCTRFASTGSGHLLYPLTTQPFASYDRTPSIRSVIFYFIKRKIISPADIKEYRKEHAKCAQACLYVIWKVVCDASGDKLRNIFDKNE